MKWSTSVSTANVVAIAPARVAPMPLATASAVLSARPGRLQRTIAVDLPRPRTLALKRTPRFLALVDEVWSLIAGSDEAAGAAEIGR